MRLNRETIVRQALTIVQEDGLPALTLRRLAGRLGVQNPALYRHFASKQRLVDEMAATMLRDAFRAVEEPAPDDAWDVWVVGLARAYRRMLLSYRDGASIIVSANLAQPDLLQRLDQTLALLHTAGFDAVTAFQTITTVFSYTLGKVFEEQNDPRLGIARFDAVQSLHQDISIPRLFLAVEQVMARNPAEAASEGFEWGLRLIIAGLRATQEAPATDRA
jgi:TetR/AcrR family tetracycline transcriptional repressor